MFSFIHIQNVGIVGCGQMGQGIAQVFALSGFRVFLVDASEDALQKGMVNITNSTHKLHKKGIVSDINCLENISVSTNLDCLLNSQLIIEAVPENLDIKKSLFKDIESKMDGKEYILATNTSSFSISKMQSFLKKPNRFLGIHFMNPPILMPLIELILGDKSDERLLDIIKPVIESLKKQFIISKDSPGFVLNRVLISMINEACLLVDEDVSLKEDIDKALKLGANFPMGPLELADYIGLDTVLAIMEELQKGLKNRFKIALSLKENVKSGKLGRKSGEGFFKY